MLEIVLKGLVGLLTAVVGFLLKEISKMKQEINKRPTMEEVDNYVDLKLEVHKHAQQDLKEDISEIKVKLDKLIDMHLSKKD